jgi:secreted Zn-dependent insulinase-like peptidase
MTMKSSSRIETRFTSLLTSALAIVLIALLSFQAGAVEVIKNPGDNRSYEYVQLDNGLKALVISDPETDKAAASLDVNIGNGSDPEGREGLAHFLEHMLFLGTQKYPHPGEYKDFINAHGGGQNAYTSFDHTNYFFNVDKDYFEPALDRFSQFFIAPLFNERYVTRERQVVNSEFVSGLKSDGRRIFSASKKALNPEHPYTNFPVGSEDTLADRPDLAVRKDLVTFYNNHYSAGLMTLVVLGKEPLDTLRTWVIEKFSAVPNTGAEPLRVQVPLYRKGTLPARLDIVPIKERRSLSLSFPIPPVAALYQAKPVSYIGHLLGHEGRGSLLSLLRERGWADELSAGTGYDDHKEATFSVSMKLTPEGMRHIDDITALVFEYLSLIDQKGVKKWIFDENRKLAEIDFRFREPPSPLSYVRGLAASLHLYPPQHVLVGPYLYARFDPGLIRGFLKSLRPDNVLITVVAKSLETDRTTPRYETPYRFASLGSDFVRRMTLKKISPALALPEPNVFIPEDLALRPPLDLTPVPVRIEHRPGIQLWHQQDRSFNTPRADFYISLRSPVASTSPKHDALTRLYVALVNDELNEFSYPANLAGLSYSLYKHMRGVTVRISGYSDKQDILLRRIVRALDRPKLDPQRFRILKQDLVRNIRNRRQNAPYDRALDELRDMLIDPQWSDEAQLSAASKMTLDQLAAFIPEFRRYLDVVMLSHGNVLPDGARKLERIVRRQLLSKSKLRQVPRGRVVKLDPGSRYLRELDSNHEESASVAYLQGEDKSLDSRAKAALLSQIVSPAFFEELRTERQLGYIVFASQMTMLETPGLALVVQSPIAGPDALSKHMNAFVRSFHSKLKNMSSEEFERHKRALVNNVLEEETQLQERTNRYWSELDQENYEFDLRQRMASAVGGITLDDLESFYGGVVLSDARKEISVHVAGTRHAGGQPAGQSLAYGERILVSSPEAFKKGRSFFDP